MIGRSPNRLFRDGLGRCVLFALHAQKYGKLFVRTGVIVGLIAALVQLFPTGDGQGVMIARDQPVTLAAMEGLFHTEAGAPLAILGQPDVPNERLDNPLTVPRALSFLTYRAWTRAGVRARSFSRGELARPNRTSLFQLSHHGGTGTIFIAILLIAAWLLFRGTLFDFETHAVGADACVAFSVHCQYGRMDHR